MLTFGQNKKLLEPNGGNSFKRSCCKALCLLSGSSLLSWSSLGSNSSAVNNSSTVNNSSSAIYNLLDNGGGVLSNLSLLGVVVGAGNHANASDNGKSQN